MSYKKTELENIIHLCDELKVLAEVVIEEGNNQLVYNMETRSYNPGATWPYHGGTKATGALRRKSLDVTRALADLRKP